MDLTYSASSKSLLLQLEDENAELTKINSEHEVMINTLQKQLHLQGKALAKAERKKELAQCSLSQTPLTERGCETAESKLVAERNRSKELANINAKHEVTIKTLQEQLRLQGNALAKAESAAHEQRLAREETARQAAQINQALREKDAGARSAARSATKFAQSLVSLEAKVRQHISKGVMPRPQALHRRGRLRRTMKRWTSAPRSGCASARVCSTK